MNTNLFVDKHIMVFNLFVHCSIVMHTFFITSVVFISISIFLKLLSNGNHYNTTIRTLLLASVK